MLQFTNPRHTVYLLLFNLKTLRDYITEPPAFLVLWGYVVSKETGAASVRN